MREIDIDTIQCVVRNTEDGICRVFRKSGKEDVFVRDKVPASLIAWMDIHEETATVYKKLNYIVYGGKG